MLLAEPDSTICEPVHELEANKKTNTAADGDEPVVAQVFDKLSDFRVATEKTIGFLLGHGAQADVWLIRQAWECARGLSEDRVNQLGEFSWIAQRINHNHPLILLSERRQGGDTLGWRSARGLE
jgi:hypothetical protein